MNKRKELKLRKLSLQGLFTGQLFLTLFISFILFSPASLETKAFTVFYIAINIYCIKLEVSEIEKIKKEQKLLTAKEL